MGKKLKSIMITGIIGAALFIFLYSRLGLEDAISSFKHITILPFAAFVCIYALIELLLTARWQIILKTYKIKVPIRMLFLYRMASFGVGYLSPQPNFGGDPIKALLLKKNKVKFKKGISTVLIDRSIQFGIDMFFAFLILFFLFASFNVAASLKTALVLIVSVPLVIIMIYFYCMFANKAFFSILFKLSFVKKIKRLAKLKKGIMDIEKNIHKFHSNHLDAFLKTIGIHCLVWCLILVQYAISFVLFGFRPSLVDVFVLLIGTTVAYNIPMPMNLGALELSQVTAISFLNIDKSIGLSISLLMRFFDVIKMIIGLITIVYMGINVGGVWKNEKDKSRI